MTGGRLSLRWGRPWRRLLFSFSFPLGGVGCTLPPPCLWDVSGLYPCFSGRPLTHEAHAGSPLCCTRSTDGLPTVAARGGAVCISELGIALSSSSSELRTSDCGCKHRPPHPPPVSPWFYQDCSVGEDRGRLKAESASISRRLGFHIQARNLSGAKPQEDKLALCEVRQT